MGIRNHPWAGPKRMIELSPFWIQEFEFDNEHLVSCLNELEKDDEAELTSNDFKYKDPATVKDPLINGMLLYSKANGDLAYNSGVAAGLRWSLSNANKAKLPAVNISWLGAKLCAERYPSASG